MNKSKALKYSLLVFAAIFALLNIVIGYLGISCFLLTITMYALIWLGLCASANVILGKQNAANGKILITTVVTCLFLAEVMLRYVFQYNLNYSEKNSGIYYSIYKVNNLEKWGRKTFNKGYDVTVKMHPPNTETFVGNSEFNYLHKFNSLGFRSPEPVKETSKTTIIGLGDSFTEGVGTPGDSTWPALLQAGLNGDSAIKPVQCIDAGINASDPCFEYMKLKKKLLAFNPKLVILCINESDINDIIVRGGRERFQNADVVFKNGPWWEFFYQFSYIFRRAVYAINKTDCSLISGSQKQAYTTAALKEISELVTEDYKTLATQNNFELVVVLSPMEWELKQSSFSIAKLEVEFTRNHIACINLYSVFKNKCDTEAKYRTYFWEKDMHNNSRGYLLWAQQIEQVIKPKLPSR